MLDEKILRRRIFLRLLGSPVTMAPLVAGMTVMTAAWALDWHPGVGLFAGLAGVLTAGGAFVTRLLVGGGRLTTEIATAIEREQQQARQQGLDALDERLATADQDPRPETALRDLRALVKVFDEISTETDPIQAATYVEIRARVGELFDRCVESLHQTDRLWQTAQRLQSAAARDPILRQREKIIDDVQASIKQVSDTMIALQTLSTGRSAKGDLARLRGELDQSLAIAKTVEQRVNDLVRNAVEHCTTQQTEKPQN